MREFKNKVAVITGAASGIGLALAQRAAGEGMKVVLADIEEAALAQAAAGLEAAGAELLAVRTDVSQAGDVEALAKKTLAAFGGVHLLCNNAGVGAGTTVWASSLADWQWALGVNLWGVIHGVHTFVPLMLKQGEPGHVVNTASIAGLISGPSLGIYKVTKHGVVSLSETLYHDLKAIKAPIGVSVLCPGWVQSRIMESERNRPAALQNEPAPPDPSVEAAVAQMKQVVAEGMPAAEAADQVFAAVEQEKFYILTHPEMKVLVRQRMEAILQDRNQAR